MDTIVKLIAENPENSIQELHNFLQTGKTLATGLTGTPLLVSIGRKLAEEVKNRENNLQILERLWKIGGRDEKLISIFALEKFSKSMPEKVYDLILNLVDDIDNWEICDQMALKVTVFLLIRLDQKMWETLGEWKSSGNFWFRRLAVATIPPYIRRKPQEAEKCLNFLESVMTDEVREVRKAVAWALREISKKDAEAAFKFMRKWKSRTPSVVKSGMKKLPKELQEILLDGI